MFWVGMIAGIFLTAVIMCCLIVAGRIDKGYDFSYTELVKIKDYLVEENEKLTEELNHRSMNDYSHGVDESWYRELYEDFKSRAYETLKYLEHQDVELEKIAFVDDGTYSVAKETILNSKRMLKGYVVEENIPEESEKDHQNGILATK